MFGSGLPVLAFNYKCISGNVGAMRVRQVDDVTRLQSLCTTAATAIYLWTRGSSPNFLSTCLAARAAGAAACSR